MQSLDMLRSLSHIPKDLQHEKTGPLKIMIDLAAKYLNPFSLAHVCHLIPFAASHHHFLRQSLPDFISGAAIMENSNTGTVKFTSKVQTWAALVAVILVVEGCFSGVAATLGCTGSMSSLAVCLPAVEGENPLSPTDACCAIVRTTDSSCLCNLVTEYSNAIGVNVGAALLLPKQCKQIIPAGYTCNGYLIPSYVPPHRKLMNA